MIRTRFTPSSPRIKTGRKILISRSLGDSISVNSVQVVASREDSLHISPDSQRRPLQVISMKTNPLLKEMLSQGKVYPGGYPGPRGRQLSGV